MKKSIAKRWVKALRSGKYQQTKSELHNDEGFCCLGVLCELAVKSEVIKPGVKRKNSNYWRYAKSSYSGLPKSVRLWADVKGDLGEQRDGGGRSLASLNDTGSSFAEIADLIEAHSENY